MTEKKKGMTETVEPHQLDQVVPDPVLTDNLSE
jgi:hypothetical protein